MSSKILLFPDTRLRAVAKPIKKVAGLEQLEAKLRDENIKARGLGVAAPQIGVSKRVFYSSVEDHEGLLVNPQIISYGEEEITMPEGCLSIPGYFWDISRPESVTVAYNKIDGEWTIETFDGMMARLCQHEIDHFNGDLLVDRITDEEYDAFEAKFFA
jgi:peptide deformylase